MFHKTTRLTQQFYGEIDFFFHDVFLLFVSAKAKYAFRTVASYFLVFETIIASIIKALEYSL